MNIRLRLASAGWETHSFADWRGLPANTIVSVGCVEGRADGGFLRALAAWLEANGVRVEKKWFPRFESIESVKFSLSYEIDGCGSPDGKRAKKPSAAKPKSDAAKQRRRTA